jgi:hypothetical protein
MIKGFVSFSISLLENPELGIFYLRLVRFGIKYKKRKSSSQGEKQGIKKELIYPHS